MNIKPYDKTIRDLREQAETLLQNFAGNLPYTLENTQ